MAGGCIVERVDENLTYDYLHASEDNLWSTLYLTGYGHACRHSSHIEKVPPESEGFTFRRDFLFFIIKASSCSLRRWPHIKELWPHWPST